MSHKPFPGRQAVFVCCDGLGAPWLDAARTPPWKTWQGKAYCAPTWRRLPVGDARLGRLGRYRLHPARHGLHGNRMAPAEDDGFCVRDVGKPDFRDHMRRATGGTLRAPTLAERAAQAGGCVAFSNVSPGAAYFLDPEHFGRVYHRAGSFAPGGGAINGHDALAISHDLAGDRAITARFCDDVLPNDALRQWPCCGLPIPTSPCTQRHWARRSTSRRCAAPMHASPRSSRPSTRCGALDAKSCWPWDRATAGSIGGCIDLDDWLGRHGLAADVAAGTIAVAGQGTAALLYATPAARPRLEGVLDRLRAEPWVGELALADDLARLGHAPTGGVVEDDEHGAPRRGRRARRARPALDSGGRGRAGPRSAGASTAAGGRTRRGPS